MTEKVWSQSPEVSITHWMWHWPLLFTTMAAPFILFEPDLAKWVSIWAGVAYGSWCSQFPQELWSDFRRPKQERSWNQNPRSVEFLLTIFHIIVPIMSVGMMFFWFIGLASWAYEVDVFKGHWPLLAFFLLLVLAPALFLVVAPACGRENGGPAFKLLKGIRDQGFGHFHLMWLSEVPFVLGMLFGFPMLSFPIIYSFMTVLNDGHAVPIWDLAIDFPLLPATLLAAAILFSAPRLYPCGNVEDSEPARAYMDGETIPTGRNKRTKTILGLTVVGGAVATLFFALYPVHVIQVARLSTFKSHDPLLGAAEVIGTLIATQREAGRSAAQIAAELNRIGSWTPDAPDAGLATLLEEPDRFFVDTCSVRISAGVTNSSVHGDFQGIPAVQAATDLKFCVAVTCASPVPWGAPPALVVYSSHESQAPNWTNEHGFMDVFADGIAPPGGYCAANGGLANRFQG